MLSFIIRRLLIILPMALLVVTVTWGLVRMAPGNFYDNEIALPAAVKANIIKKYGLDKEWYQQYGIMMWNIVRGDFGDSVRYEGQSVNEIIWRHLPYSATIGILAYLLALGIGLTAGIVASLKQNSAFDYVSRSLAMLGQSVPNFVIGPLLVLVFALKLEWVRVSGWDDWIDRILPSITLGVLYAAYIARLTRGGMLEILSQDFIRTARAKGASQLRVVMKHALRGGLVPVVSYLGPAVAGLVTGSFVVESIFQVPGLGRYFVNAAFNRDYTMVLGAVLFYASLIVLFNLLVDLVLVWMDPKQKFA